MVRFIFLCVAVTILSFGIVPAYVGISSEHADLVANIEPAVGVDPGELENGTSLTFEEIYALSDLYNAGSLAQDDMASILNNIEPSAEEISVSQDNFSAGFDIEGHPAL